MTRSQGNKQQRVKRYQVVKRSARQGSKMKPNRRKSNELTIHKQLIILFLVKRQQLKQQIMISGQVRIQTLRLQLATAVGMPRRMRRSVVVVSMGYVDTLMTKMKRASKKGKQISVFNFINATTSPQAAKISNMRYSMRNLYFFLFSLPVSSSGLGAGWAVALVLNLEEPILEPILLGGAKLCMRMNCELFSMKFSQVFRIGSWGWSMMNCCSNMRRWASCYQNFIQFVNKLFIHYL